MNSFIAHIAHLMLFAPVAGTAQPADGVARQLMERAEAGAGRNPQEAQELRSAACAYLSVVR
ncbi:MAG: hypothetical protein JWQ72_3734 [Polaromonas sp.]|nr:hypothetical protein [Polaromonas sp.]